MQVAPAIGGFNKFELLSFSLPLTQYNITSDNNQIYFNVGGTDYTAEITSSAYTVCTLPSEIKRVMDFYIQIPEFGSHVRTTHENDWATFVITSFGNSGDINQFNMFSHYQLLEYYGQSNLRDINVRIMSRGNTLVDLNNSDWVMVLKLHYPDTQFI